MVRTGADITATAGLAVLLMLAGSALRRGAVRRGARRRLNRRREAGRSWERPEKF